MNFKKNISMLLIPAVLATYNAYSHENDDPILASVHFDKLEHSSNSTTLETQAWIGKDINKFWLKSDIENHQGDTEHADVQALYSHAIAPYWDFQAGIRQDIKPVSKRTWGVIGIQGLAPYFFDIDAALFIGESGRTSAQISAGYDLLFTQRLILSPELTINFYGQNDRETGMGSGLSTVNAGLRLRYEIRREFAPYMGVSWNKKYGNAADFSRHQYESVDDTKWVLGLRMWF